jgi:dissimilatory sulfite reductase (desulfoviridin) alpha/beta subunit
MFYYLYEIKNTINNKIYVGVHKTANLNDGYMGSGKAINRAIKKYGVENFTKTILEYFTNETSMYSKEKEVVNEEFLARPDVYNLSLVI